MLGQAHITLPGHLSWLKTFATADLGPARSSQNSPQTFLPVPIWISAQMSTLSREALTPFCESAAPSSSHVMVLSSPHHLTCHYIYVTAGCLAGMFCNGKAFLTTVDSVCSYVWHQGSALWILVKCVNVLNHRRGSSIVPGLFTWKLWVASTLSWARL